MLMYVLRRLLWTIPVLLVCTTILFGLMRVGGGNFLRHPPPAGLSNVGWVKYGDPKPESITRNIERRLGLDLPWYEQYAHYLGSVARLDFGPTFTFAGRSVNSILREQGVITLELALLALGWAIALGIPVGIAAALTHGGLLDRAVTALTAVTMGIPVFFVGTVLAWLFAVKLALVPPFGWTSWQTKILPVAVLGLVPFAQIVRVLRFEMLETLGRDHVLAARGKGLRRSRVVSAHVVRPSLIPLVSMPGPILGQLVAGLFVVEWIFSIPGIGRYFIAAAEVGDYPLTLGLTIVLTLMIVLANLLSDIALMTLDPSLRDAAVKG
ncbi:MAG TPA: ABC transporter permease [Gaiella sp.]|jgi:oligopeptide transport system permease protein|nr:ABC transporter permease [Gaiella sp.]